MHPATEVKMDRTVKPTSYLTTTPSSWGLDEKDMVEYARDEKSRKEATLMLLQHDWLSKKKAQGNR